MRRLLAITAAMAASGWALALPVAPAAADGFGGSGTAGQGSYTVPVMLTGDGVGSGGSLGGSPVRGGTVSVPSLCGYQSNATQQEIEAAYGGVKAAAQDALARAQSFTPDTALSMIWGQGIIDKWGKQGTWQLPDCKGAGIGQLEKFVASNKPELVGPGGLSAPPVPKLDPKVLEGIAARAMTLPKLGIGHSLPAAADGQTLLNQTLSGLPGGVHFWVTPKMDVGAKRTVTASAGGVSATAVATFNGVKFSSRGSAKPASVLCRDLGQLDLISGVAAPSPCALTDLSGSGADSFTVLAKPVWSATVGSLAGTRAIEGAGMTDQLLLKVTETQNGLLGVVPVG